MNFTAMLGEAVQTLFWGHKSRGQNGKTGEDSVLRFIFHLNALILRIVLEKPFRSNINKCHNGGTNLDINILARA